MEIVVEGEDISPEEFCTDAGWLDSHRQKNKKALKTLNLMTDVDRKQNGVQPGAALHETLKQRKPPRKPRQPDLPKEDIKIILRPRHGLDVSRTSHVLLRDCIIAAAKIDPKEADEDTMRTNNYKNIIVISSPSIERAKAYNSINTLKIKEHEHEIVAYATPPEECTKGVIHNIPSEESEETISRSLVNKRNPSILQARRMGKTNSVVIVFEGQKVPYFVYYRGTEYRCYLHKKRHEICRSCGRLGHRADVCPAPENKVCIDCGKQDPPSDHTCAPKCALCGGDHQTGDKKCSRRFHTPFILKKRSWEKKKKTLERQRYDKNQRTPDEDSGGILKHGKSQISLFPELPPAGNGKNQHQERGRTSRDPTPSHTRNSRSASRQRGNSKARSRSKSQSRNGTNVASSDGRQEMHSTNTVSWANAVSQGGTQTGKLHTTNEENSQSELAKIRKMLQMVLEENRQLKEEIAKLKAKDSHDNEETKMELTQNDKATPDPSDADNTSPPTKRRAVPQKSEMGNSLPHSPHKSEEYLAEKFKQCSEELDRKLEAQCAQLFDRLDASLAKHINNLNVRLFALENARTQEGSGGQIGPVKTTKPYARLSMIESTRNQKENS